MVSCWRDRTRKISEFKLVVGGRSHKLGRKKVYPEGDPQRQAGNINGARPLGAEGAAETDSGGLALGGLAWGEKPPAGVAPTAQGEEPVVLRGSAGAEPRRRWGRGSRGE